MSDLTRGLHAIDRARIAYDLAEAMYKGTNIEYIRLGHQQLEAILRQAMEKMGVNIAAKTVRSRLNRLSVNAMRVVGKDPESPEHAAIAQISQDNELDLELPDALKKMAIYGDAYLSAWPANGEVVGASAVAKQVDLFARSPKSMRAMYDRENNRKILYVIDTWCDEGDYLRVNLYYEDRVERYISVTERETHTGVQTYADEMFVPFVPEPDDEDEEPGDSVLPNPWGRLPIVHLRSDRPYGVPVHWDAYGPQNILTSLVANEMGAITGYSFPFRYALSKAGTTGADLNDWPTDAEQAPNNTHGGRHGRLHGDDEREKLDDRPGTLTKFHDTDAIGQLTPPDSKNFIDPIDQHIRLFSSITDTPMDISASGAPESGESRKAKLDGLLASVELLQRAAGSAIANAMEIALLMLGFADERVVVEWKPAEKVSDKDGWDAVVSQETAGVPRRDALIEAGYLPEQVDAWESSLDGRLELFNSIAATATALGQAAQLSGVDMAVITEAVSALVAEALADGTATD